MDYMTKEEAEKQAAALNAQLVRTDMFCPLINGNCNTACVCYFKAQVRIDRDVRDPDKRYYIYQGYCNNGMFD